MSSRKRQASDTLAPSRKSKQPRLALTGYDGGTPSPSEKERILARWNRLGKQFVDLLQDTAGVMPTFIFEGFRDTSDPLTGTTPRQINSPVASPLNSDDDEYPLTQSQLHSTRAMPSTAGSIYQYVNKVAIYVFGRSQPSPETSPTPSFPESQIKGFLNGDESSQSDQQLGKRTPTMNHVDRASPSSNPHQGGASHRASSDPSYEDPIKLADTRLWVYEDVSNGIDNLHLGSQADSSFMSSQISKLSTTSSNPYSQRSSILSISTQDSPRRNHRNRTHIYQKVHKAEVRRSHKEIREELYEVYRHRRRSGFTSTFSDFQGLLNYQVQLGDIGMERPRRLPTYNTSFLGDLKPKVLPARTRRRSYADDEDPFFLQRILDNAKATLNSPKPPKPFLPTFEQQQILERAKDDAIERRLRPKPLPLPSNLPPEDEANVNALLRKNGVISKFAREQVSDQDISRLRPGQWLNDEIINFYGAMILSRSEGNKENPGPQVNKKKGKQKLLDVHYFSSFFWAKLTKEGYEKGRLSKWTKKLDIFSKDVILIPVNHSNAHWTAAAINFRRKRVESYDSMGMAKETVFKHLRAYIDAEHSNKKKRPFDFTGWENWAPDDTTPQQENGYDCGVFTCQFLESLSRGEEFFSFTQKDMTYLRRRMIWEIGNARLRDDY